MVGKLLVVDDEDLVRKVLVRSLTRLGYEAVDVADGRSALDLVAAGGADIACVLLDLSMPDMDGYEVFRGLRELNAELPVVIMSGHPECEVTDGLAPASASGYLGKPFMMADVQAVMERLGLHEGLS